MPKSALGSKETKALLKELDSLVKSFEDVRFDRSTSTKFLVNAMSAFKTFFDSMSNKWYSMSLNLRHCLQTPQPLKFFDKSMKDIFMRLRECHPHEDIAKLSTWCSQTQIDLQNISYFVFDLNQCVSKAFRRLTPLDIPPNLLNQLKRGLISQFADQENPQALPVFPELIKLSERRTTTEDWKQSMKFLALGPSGPPPQAIKDEDASMS